MALRDIITRLAKEFGQNLSDTAQANGLITDVNTVVRDLHNSREAPLRHSLRERLVDIGASAEQVALPSDIGKILQIRNPETFDDVRLKGFEDRYMRQSWYPPFLEYRVKEKSALKVNMLTGGPITVTFSKPVLSPVNVILTGQTQDSERVQETLLFAVGDTARTSMNSFYDLEAIRKSVTTAYNLSVTDIQDVEIAAIPNNKTQARYQILQTLEAVNTVSRTRILEVLHKLDWQPFVNLDDTYYGTEDYDTAFYWATKSLMLDTQGDSSKGDVIFSQDKATTLLAAIDAEAENGEKEIYDAPVAAYGVQPTLNGGYNSRVSGRGYGYGTRY